MESNGKAEEMKAYSVLYSYPTWDKNYRGQRGIRVLALSEREAETTALKQAPQGSRILRVQLSKNQPEIV